MATATYPDPELVSRLIIAALAETGLDWLNIEGLAKEFERAAASLPSGKHMLPTTVPEVRRVLAHLRRFGFVAWNPTDTHVTTTPVGILRHAVIRIPSEIVGAFGAEFKKDVLT